MLSPDPKLPQLSSQESQGSVSTEFWRRFQERFYVLWRELAVYLDNFLVQAPVSATDNKVLRFDGTTGNKIQGSDVYVTDDGRLYGTALHNNAGAVTGTTNQYVASGTYTPTYTAVANCTVTSGGACQWLRVGNVVTVSGQLEVNPTTAATTTTWGISLPIASALNDFVHCSGVCVSVYDSATIEADLTNDRANVSTALTNSGDVNRVWTFTFTYVVL